MTKSILTVIAGAALVAGTIFAQEAKEQEGENDTNAKMKAYAEMGAGVQNVKTETVNGKNVFKSCIIVGEARFSTTLGIGKGLAVARRNAKLKAEGEFVSWLKTHTSAVRTSGDETVYELAGKDGEGVAEIAASTETSTEQITSAAQGAIRGMQKIGEYRDSELKMLYVIYAWKPGLAELATQVEEGMEPAKQEKTQKDKSSSAKGAKDAEKKPFEDKIVVAPEADEFL